MAIEWIELIIVSSVGGGIGFTIQKALEVWSNVRANKEFPYIGTYNAYRYSTKGNGKIIHQVWTTRKRIDRKIELKISEPNIEGFSYIGVLWTEGGHIYVQVKGSSHIENMFYIFHEPVGMSLGETIGVISAITMAKQPWSAKQLLCLDTLTDEAAIKKLGVENKIITKLSELMRLR